MNFYIIPIPNSNNKKYKIGFVPIYYIKKS